MATITYHYAPGTIRNKPLSPDLAGALTYAADVAGIDEIRVYSGGQPAKGGNRTGSHRHDRGGAADLDLVVDGRVIDHTTTEGQAVAAPFVTAAVSAGPQGVGAGNDYMGPSRIHVGYGSSVAWGAKGKSANAPAWIRKAHVAGRQNVTNTQKTLAKAGLYDGAIDGDVGPKMREALRKYAMANPATETRVADAAGVYENDPFGVAGSKIPEIDDAGRQAIAAAVTGLPRDEAEAAAQAIRDIYVQEGGKLPVGDIIKAYAEPDAEKQPAPAVEETGAFQPSDTLRRQRGAPFSTDNLKLQARLAKRGYDVGPLDGRFGKATERALKAFQADHDLDVSGATDPATIAALAPVARGQEQRFSGPVDVMGGERDYPDDGPPAPDPRPTISGTGRESYGAMPPENPRRAAEEAAYAESLPSPRMRAEGAVAAAGRREQLSRGGQAQRFAPAGVSPVLDRILNGGSGNEIQLPPVTDDLPRPGTTIAGRPEGPPGAFPTSEASDETPVQAVERMMREYDRFSAGMEDRRGQGFPPFRSTDVFSPGQTGETVRALPSPVARGDPRLAGMPDDPLAGAPVPRLEAGDAGALAAEQSTRAVPPTLDQALGDAVRREQMTRAGQAQRFAPSGPPVEDDLLSGLVTPEEQSTFDRVMTTVFGPENLLTDTGLVTPPPEQQRPAPAGPAGLPAPGGGAIPPLAALPFAEQATRDPFAALLAGKDPARHPAYMEVAANLSSPADDPRLAGMPDDPLAGAPVPRFEAPDAFPDPAAILSARNPIAPGIDAKTAGEIVDGLFTVSAARPAAVEQRQPTAQPAPGPRPAAPEAEGAGTAAAPQRSGGLLQRLFGGGAARAAPGPGGIIGRLGSGGAPAITQTGSGVTPSGQPWSKGTADNGRLQTQSWKSSDGSYTVNTYTDGFGNTYTKFS